MRKILVINDSQFERIIMKDLVSKLGYEVKMADEYNSLDVIEYYNPNIVIANMTMNNTTGDKLIGIIKKKHPDIKCILSSCSEILPEQLQNKEIDAFIVTPITPEKLDKILSSQGPFQDVFSEEGISDMYSSKSLENIAVIEPARISYSFCPYCGQKIPEKQSGYVFCPFCGSKF